jgi:hypothetical protein
MTATPIRGLVRQRLTGLSRKFQKYSEEDFVKDVFDEGYVDVGIFNPTYLKQWYTEGFNTTERNARLAEKYPAS